METKIIIIVSIAVLLVIILASCIKIVPQAHSYILERLGAFQAAWGVGIHFKVPFIDRVAKKVLLKEQVVDFDPQPVITKDNVTMRIDTVVFYQITDPKLYAYGVENPIMAIENLTATTLRNIIGELELDQTLTSRETINTKMRSSLDIATDPWGIKVNRVEVKNILPPRDIQEAMEKQMRAERERREAILKAEGEKKSAILIAEGEKESAILRAEAKKKSKIKEINERLQKLKVIEIEEKEYIEFKLTYYSSDPSENIPGMASVTCEGKKLEEGICASNVYPLGTRIVFNDGTELVVKDRGGKDFNNYNRIDVFIEREPGEDNRTYLKRVNNLGIKHKTGYVIYPE